jgi:flagellar protein FliL
MAEEEKKQEQPEASTEPEPIKKSSFFNQKAILIGLPLFIIQLVAVYFITANFLLNRVEGSTPKGAGTKTEKKDEKANASNKVELGKFIFLIEDVIVNPAGTEGKKLLLASIGFDLSSEVEQQELKSKEVLVKDVIVSTLSSKSLEQLSDSSYRDKLKNEIGQKVINLIPDLKLNAVYFSKYIIQ